MPNGTGKFGASALKSGPLEDVLWGVNSVLLYYINQRGTRTAEFMELSAIGKVARVVANYSA